MAYATDIRAGQATSTGRNGTFLTGLRARFAAFRVYRTTLQELSRLDDRDLADLGLERSNIRNAATQATYGH